MRDGQIGRFGWKAQVAKLQDFVMTACANELGLEVPGHHQAASPVDNEARVKALKASQDELLRVVASALGTQVPARPQATAILEPDAETTKQDLTQNECDALAAYVRSLPAPVALKPSSERDFRAIKEGNRLFTAIGCADCHMPSLGNIRNIYSDLLLHEMGPDLSDPGEYYDDHDERDSTDSPKVSEWRTPPLWGFRDSGPYLHDGRAQTLEETVARHGGQARESARRFRRYPRGNDLRSLRS